MADVFHAGEAHLQGLAGSRERLAEVGPRVIRQEMPEQHRDFFAGLPFIVAAGVEADGQPRATLLAGAPGFISAPDGRHLHIAAAPAPDEPLTALLQAGARIGLLGIEAHTRRRNRANGRIVASPAGALVVAIEQSFGNCPKYIQPRQAVYDPAARQPGPTAIRGRLTGPEHEWLRAADTFFIASAHPSDDGNPAHGVDVSHRGGPPGFIRLEGDALLIDDFAGNNYFNTLGNLMLNPRAELLFPDFAGSGLLSLSVRAEILPGPPRQLRLGIEQVRHQAGALPLRWLAPEG